MYMMNWNDTECRIEASIGGHLDVAEMRVFGEELREALADTVGQPYLVLIDQTGASNMDLDAADVLGDIKDECLQRGAERVVSVVASEQDLAFHINVRIQAVLDGTEQIVLQGREHTALRRSVAQTTSTVIELRKAA